MGTLFSRNKTIIKIFDKGYFIVSIRVKYFINVQVTLSLKGY